MGFESEQPAYSGSGIAIWNATDKNGKAFLKVKVLNGSAINCFKVEVKKDEHSFSPLAYFFCFAFTT